MIQVKRRRLESSYYNQVFKVAAHRMTPDTKTPVAIRFRPDLLAKIDAAAGRLGLGRASWIRYGVSRTIDGGEG